ncbi:MAG TPA: hypothetical protein VJP85_12575 [Candidatus Baltobacteraceae bacterium]|nr:hypothetical protein [Candidatus Baltobacteraceae bacterium]
MKSMSTRGTALPETALTIGLALLLVLGAAQMAIIGYTQISADGAAFIAAHTQVQNPNANGQSVAHNVFSNVDLGDFGTPAPSPSVVPMTVNKIASGFPLMPGLASKYAITGKDVEYAPTGSGATPAPFSFSVGSSGLATIANYCDGRKQTCYLSNWSVYLAQGVGNGNGNGVNGIFSEWRCHQRYFASVNWPNARPQGYAAINGNKTLDPYTNSSTENTIYGWDSGTHRCQ